MSNWGDQDARQIEAEDVLERSEGALLVKRSNPPKIRVVVRKRPLNRKVCTLLDVQ